MIPFQLFYAERHTALLLYGTNGKTGSPTGMLYRHYNLNAQADGMAQVDIKKINMMCS